MSQADLMYRVAALQCFDGSFNLDGAVCSAINVPLSTAQQEARKNGWNEKAFAAILVLAFFKEKLESLQDDWELIADKSRLWILSTAANQADDMFDSAIKLVCR